MRVSCEDYNQCQLAQPDLTAHTGSRNIFPFRTHTYAHMRIMHTLYFSLCLSFFPSLSVSHPYFFPITHTDGCWVPLQWVTEHRQQEWDKEIVTPHSVCWVCIALTTTRVTGLMSVSVTVNVIPSETCVCMGLCVCVCVRALICAFLAFYLGIASEQFTACHSLSRTGSKSERKRRMERKERERERSCSRGKRRV